MIEVFLKERNIIYCTDKTNAGDDYSRNRVRNLIFPIIKQNLNTAVASNLCRLSENLREDSDFLETHAKNSYSSCKIAIAAPGGSPGINLTAFKVMHPAIKSRVIRILYEEAAGSNNDLECKHINAVLDLCEKETGKSLSLPGGFVAENSYLALYICKKSPENREFSYELNPGQTLFIKELGKAVKMGFENDCNNITKACTRAFSYDIMKDGIKIRSRRNGDKIYLSEIGGSKKLSDYFTDNKIPRSERGRVPLLACGSDILWIFDKKGMGSGKYLAQNLERAIYVSVY
jgi:tRNA(Ile)-lysidine synthase